eukprot:scaffold449_cov184-Amphora_coffeaeformis.AAC.5
MVLVAHHHMWCLTFDNMASRQLLLKTRSDWAKAFPFAFMALKGGQRLRHDWTMWLIYFISYTEDISLSQTNNRYEEVVDERT